MVFLLGIFLGMIVNVLILFVEKKDVSIGRLTPPVGALVCLFGGLFMLFGAGAFGLHWTPTAAVFVNGLMLLFTSYTDLRCGQVYVASVYFSAFFEALIVIYLFAVGRLGRDIFWVLACAIVCVAFICVFGLAGADGMIYVSCILSHVVVCRAYFLLSIMCLVFVSSVLGAVFNFGNLWKKEDRRKRFPFTAYICVGCLVSYLMFSFMVYAD